MENCTAVGEALLAAVRAVPRQYDAPTVVQWLLQLPRQVLDDALASREAVADAVEAAEYALLMEDDADVLSLSSDEGVAATCSN